MNNIFKFNKKTLFNRKLCSIDNKLCTNNFILNHALIFTGTIGISSFSLYNYLENKQKLNYEHELPLLTNVKRKIN